jgi:hypothetical protein
VDLKGEALLCARAGYYGLINHVDDHIRRLNPVTGVDRMTGHNTSVMLTSDHGEMLGDHYRWHKVVPYEPSVRIPMLLRAPASVETAPSNARISSRFSTVGNVWSRSNLTARSTSQSRLSVMFTAIGKCTTSAIGKCTTLKAV